jgi:hypothetical protein
MVCIKCGHLQISNVCVCVCVERERDKTDRQRWESVS